MQRSTPVPVRSTQNGRRRSSAAGLVQSSLDLVWSYERSHAYFGANLPGSSPSFVHRERYFPQERLSNERSRRSGDEESLVSDEVSRHRDSFIEDESESNEERWSEEERLPPNAVRQRTTPRPSRAQLAGMGSPTERTALLAGQRPISQMLGTSPPADEIPFARPILSPHAKSTSAIDEDVDEYVGSAHPTASSTALQTLFNAINVLVGVSILAEPLAFARAGWVIGSITLVFCGLLTNWTAKLLARMLARDQSLMTYADIAAKAFGPSARAFVSLIFVLELTGLAVALLVLFGDSCSSLFGLSSTIFKVIGLALITPTLFLPLRLLSITSLIGIVSTLTLLTIVVIDGTWKRSSPGSLVDPMPTQAGPPDWLSMPIAFGLIMGGFGGHAVMPALARDMLDPRKFDRVIDCAYFVTFSLYMLMGALGYVMFGDTVTDEITLDLRKTPGFPRIPTLIAVGMIAVNPLCKFAIGTKPLQMMLEWSIGVADVSDLPPEEAAMMANQSGIQSVANGKSGGETSSTIIDRSNALAAANSSRFSLAAAPPIAKLSTRIALRIGLVGLLTVVSIVFPSFQRVMALLGAFACFIVSAHLPILAHLKLNWSTVGWIQVGIIAVVLTISTFMAVTGTIAVFATQAS